MNYQALAVRIAAFSKGKKTIYWSVPLFASYYCI